MNRKHCRSVLILSALVATQVLQGCGSSKPDQLVWYSGATGPIRREEPTWEWCATYCAWEDGRSLAIVVPMRSLITAPSQSTEPGKRWQKIFVSVEHGAILHNDRVLCKFPDADNTCYILGSDLKLHDSGRSAEWFAWLLMNRKWTHKTPWGATLEAIQTVDENGDSIVTNSPLRVTTIASPAEARKQEHEFWESVCSLVLPEDFIWCQPGANLEFDGSAWELRAATNVDVGCEARWSAILSEPPPGWKSRFPRDEYSTKELQLAPAATAEVEND